MNRLTVRLAAAALAAGVTAAELIGLSLLAETALSPGDSMLVMPRVVVTPAALEDGPGDPGTRAQAEVSKPRPRT